MREYRGIPKVRLWTGSDPTSPIVLDRDVLSLQTSKPVSGQPGTWSVTLLPNFRAQRGELPTRTTLPFLYRSVKANDVVSIGFETEGGIMAGLVDRVARTRVEWGQDVTTGLTISGQCLGKVLVTDNVVQASLAVPDLADFTAKVRAVLGNDTPLLNGLPGVWGPQGRDGVPTFLGRTVKEAVEWVLDNAASMRLPLLAAVTGGSGEPADYMSVDDVVTWHDGRVWSDAASSHQGTIQAFIQSIIDPDFYEFRVDYKPGNGALPNCHLIIRPKPYDERGLEWMSVREQSGSTWEDLTTFVNGRPHHEIGAGEVGNENLGTSDAEAFSYYQVSSRFELLGGDDGFSQGLRYPLVDLWAAKRFGNRAYNARLSLVGGDVARIVDKDVEYTSEVAGYIEEARNRLLNWYRMNPVMETGAITCNLRDEFRPGDPVFLPWAGSPLGGEKGLRYYCVQVNNSWTYGSNPQSTLRLTRGHNAAMIDAFRELITDGAPDDNPDMLAAT